MSTTPAVPPPQQGRREGILGAPTRHPLEWRTEAFYDAAAITTITLRTNGTSK